MWPVETIRLVAKLPQPGIFMTGIEGSDPAVDGVRRNQLQEAHDFYVHYRQRLQNIADLGLEWIRFGPPYSQVHLGPDHYDFEFMDKVVKTCDELGINLVADLLHFGLPDWMHENHDMPYFQNPLWPTEFAKYAAAFAKHYPTIQFYTPVNEPFVTAFLSAKAGIWNEQRASHWQDDHDFVRAAANIAKAVILARKAIDHVWLEENRPDEPIYIQNESFELAIPVPGSGREAEANRFNLRRFTLLDLMLGHRDQTMARYLMNQGLSAAEYEWFMDHGNVKRTILGIDHYPWCIHEYQAEATVDHDVTKPYRLLQLIDEYWERYPLPLIHTEINAQPDNAVAMLQQTYDVLARLRGEGYPILGMAWYGDELQVGWQAALRGPAAYDEYPVGLFYKGEKQPVAELYAELAAKGLPPFDHREARFRMNREAVKA